MKKLRMALMSGALVFALLGTAGRDVQAADATRNVAGKMLRDASLMLLKEGNERHVAGRPQHPNLDVARRTSTVTGGQEPFATILACADSRAPVELLFDRGIGDLFVIRVAGNVADDSELASLEYGVEHLNTPVLVVLGHTKCGAVTAVASRVELPGHLHHLAELIEPAARKARAEASGADDLVPRAIQAHVWNTLERILRESSVIRQKAEAGSLHLVGALYDLETGRVSWLGSHPAHDAIIALANQAATDAALAQSKDSFAPSTPKKTGTPGLATGPGTVSPQTPIVRGFTTHGVQTLRPDPTAAATATPSSAKPSTATTTLPSATASPKSFRGLAGGALEPSTEPRPPAREH